MSGGPPAPATGTPLAAARMFDLPGEPVSAEPFGSGHINDTYLVCCGTETGETARTVLQRLNTHVFRDPAAVMANIERVTAHLADRRAQAPPELARYGALRLLRTRGGEPALVDADGDWWRAYERVPDVRSLDTASSEEQAWEAARAFGAFHRLLADLPADALRETIPGFHDTPRRFAALEGAARTDRLGRAAAAAPELAFARARAGEAGRILAAAARGLLPWRVTHNDTKINNVLFRATENRAACVVDLDTVMPGLSLFDFGDLVRTSTCGAAEDECNLELVRFRSSYYEALEDGYRSLADAMLTDAERELLPFSGRLITLEIGVRFLTDYLEGDHYFRVHRPDHNLDRCRTQFRLVEELERHFD